MIGVVVGGWITYLVSMQLGRAQAQQRRTETLQHRLLDAANAYLGVVAEFRRHADETHDWIANWKASQDAGHTDAAAISWDRRTQSIARRDEEEARARVELVRLHLLSPDLARLAGPLLISATPTTDQGRQEAAEAKWTAAKDALLVALRSRLDIPLEP